MKSAMLQYHTRIKTQSLLCSKDNDKIRKCNWGKGGESRKCFPWVDLNLHVLAKKTGKTHEAQVKKEGYEYFSSSKPKISKTDHSSESILSHTSATK